ncbi:hypothetical protein [Rhabdothermincola salaria]|uniref:hypothetical protein n=1 Tax=Rhabdothermincola salaria TaxID=2903142 RepID=UPI001E4F5710|nr:hypothetical protein [Rhabdothermincola salaria]MCD9624560.1 hypothetical protein [Rhabdothermincola salaria]
MPLRRSTPTRPTLIDTHCVRHQFEEAIDRCRVCDEPFCGECLVFAFGAEHPPYCLNCALSAAGVRVRGARPAKVSRRELRRREKEAAARAKAEAESPPQPPIDWSFPGAEEGSADSFSFFDEPFGSSDDDPR